MPPTIGHRRKWPTKAPNPPSALCHASPTTISITGRRRHAAVHRSSQPTIGRRPPLERSPMAATILLCSAAQKPLLHVSSPMLPVPFPPSAMPRQLPKKVAATAQLLLFSPCPFAASSVAHSHRRATTPLPSLLLVHVAILLPIVVDPATIRCWSSSLIPCSPMVVQDTIRACNNVTMLPSPMANLPSPSSSKPAAGPASVSTVRRLLIPAICLHRSLLATSRSPLLPSAPPTTRLVGLLLATCQPMPHLLSFFPMLPEPLPPSSSPVHPLLLDPLKLPSPLPFMVLH